VTNVTEVAKLHPEDQAQVPTLPSESLLLSFPENYLEPRWYAVYTIARHEKRVAEQMDTPVAGQSAIRSSRRHPRQEWNSDQHTVRPTRKRRRLTFTSLARI